MDSQSYKEVIAIGSDHFNTLWLVRALGMAGYLPTAIIIGNKDDRSFVGKSRYCKCSYCLHSNDELLTFLDNLDLPQRTVLIATSDSVAELLDMNYNHLSEKYYLCNCGQKEGGVCHWMDKRNQLECAKEKGLRLPYSQAFNLENELNDYSQIKYPSLIKPEVSAITTKDSFRICYNENELKKALREIQGHCKSVIVQEYIEHENEYLLYGVSFGEEVIIPGGDYKLISCTDTNNLGMHVYGYVSSQHPVQFRSIDQIKQFVKRLGYQGIFSVEVMLTKESYCFLEINLRNDGTSYLFTEAGVNIPAIWTSFCYGYDISIYPVVFKRDKTFGLNEVNYIKYGIRKAGLLGTIKNLLRSKVFSLYKQDDIKPLIYKILYH